MGKDLECKLGGKDKAIAYDEHVGVGVSILVEVAACFLACMHDSMVVVSVWRKMKYEMRSLGDCESERGLANHRCDISFALLSLSLHPLARTMAHTQRLAK